MIIGIPKEIKNNEFRVSITPYGVKELINNNHTVFIEKNAGYNSSFTDEDYILNVEAWDILSNHSIINYFVNIGQTDGDEIYNEDRLL